MPFTMRRHTLLLPVGAELTMGQKSYEQVGLLFLHLPQDTPAAVSNCCMRACVHPAFTVYYMLTRLVKGWTRW